MNSKQEVKQLLKEAGKPELFTEENYRIATLLTKAAEKYDPIHREAPKFSEQSTKTEIFETKFLVSLTMDPHILRPSHQRS